MALEAPAVRAAARYDEALAKLDAIDGGRARPTIHVTAGSLVTMVHGGIAALREAGILQARAVGMLCPDLVEKVISGEIENAQPEACNAFNELLRQIIRREATP